ncbi:MAG: hypothetical protein JWO62_1117 [Acidimicrobiaceae bacterium]|nr:hypothetical protein [Acidimicrobiaceae bacterium]
MVDAGAGVAERTADVFGGLVNCDASSPLSPDGSRTAGDGGYGAGVTRSGRATAEQRRSRPRRLAGRRLLRSSAAGLIAGVVSSFFTPWQAAELIGWDLAAAGFLVAVWIAVGHLDADGTSSRARAEDPSAPVADLVIVSAGVACIVGAGLALIRAGQSGGATKAYLIALAIASVVVSWASVHTVFALRYARLYYGDTNGGIDFKSDAPPDYRDFAYVAFTVGMTFQVSDTDIKAPRIRRVVLSHSLLSYLFGAVIIGLTINVVASLLR